MRSASACAGSPCARACYVRAHACAPVRRTRAPMRYQWGSALGIVWKDFDKKEEEKLSRGWMVSTTRSNPSRSVHVITQTNLQFFFPSFFRSIFFFLFYCFHFFLRVSTAESEKERFFIAHDHCMKIRLEFPLFFRASEICPPQDKK